MYFIQPCAKFVVENVKGREASKIACAGQESVFPKGKIKFDFKKNTRHFFARFQILCLDIEHTSIAALFFEKISNSNANFVFTF